MIIQNGMIFDGMGGKPFVGDILIEGDRIRKVSEHIRCDEDVIDAKGCYVLPGFIDTMNYYGCQGPGWADDDTAETEKKISPQMSVYYSFDYGNMNFQQLYHYGTTSVGIIPSLKNIIGGKGSVFHTYALTNGEGLIKKDCFMVGAVENMSKSETDTYPMTRMGIFSGLYKALRDAEEYSQKEEEPYNSIEHLVPVIQGEMPLILYAETFCDMERVVHLMETFPNVIYSFSGCFGYSTAIKEIAPEETFYLLGDQTFFMNENLRKIDYKQFCQGGMNLAIGNIGKYAAAGKESLLWNGQLMFKHGYALEKVIQAMTSAPARMLKVENKVGSIRPGLLADITIWDKNPISRHDAVLKKVFISGENVLHKERGTLCW